MTAHSVLRLEMRRRSRLAPALPDPSRRTGLRAQRCKCKLRISWGLPLARMPMAFIGGSKPFPAVALLFIAALSGASVANPAEADRNPARERRRCRTAPRYAGGQVLRASPRR